MRPIEIESWARRICERLTKGYPLEDARVELKSIWPEPEKTARQVAGHANAARGDSILWLIGVDEKKSIILGASHQELSDWWAKMRTGFESDFPALQDLNIDIDGKTIVALCFDSSRFPYVVKNEAFGKAEGGPVRFEVPWREGSSTRTATRGDLVLMFSALSKIPKVELLDGEINLQTSGVSTFSFELKVYIVPLDTAPAYFPIHKCTAELWSGGEVIADSFSIKMDTSKAKEDRMNHQYSVIRSIASRLSTTNVAVKAAADAIEATKDELQVRGAGKVIFEGDLAPATKFRGQDDFELHFRFVEAITELPIVLRGTFNRVKGPQGAEQLNRWVLSR